MITLTYQDFLYHIDRGVGLGLEQVSFSVYQTNPYVIKKYIEKLISSEPKYAHLIKGFTGRCVVYLEKE